MLAAYMSGRIESEWNGGNMEISRCVKESFTVIGKEGSTGDWEGFIMRLWEDANSHFGEVADLAKKAD